MSVSIVGFDGTLSAEVFVTAAVLKHQSDPNGEAKSYFFRADSEKRYTANEICTFRDDGYLTLLSEETRHMYADVLQVDGNIAGKKNSALVVLVTAQRLENFYEIRPLGDWNPRWLPLDGTYFSIALATPSAAQNWLDRQASWFMLQARKEMAYRLLPLLAADEATPIPAGTTPMPLGNVSPLPGDAEPTALRARAAAERYTEYALLAAQTPAIQQEVHALRTIVLGYDSWRGKQRALVVRQEMKRLFNLGTESIDALIQIQHKALNSVVHQDVPDNLETAISEARQRTLELSDDEEQARQAQREAQQFRPQDTEEKVMLMRKITEWSNTGPRAVLRVTEKDALILASEPGIYTARKMPLAKRTEANAKNGEEFPEKYLIYHSILSSLNENYTDEEH